MSPFAVLIACATTSLAGDAAARFEVKVVAEAPLVSNPVIVQCGGRNTLWVVDRMNGEDTIVVLDDADGAPRTRRVFVEHLIGVRGVVPLSDRRALVLEPPNLLDIVDVSGDGKSDAVRVIGSGLANGSGLALTADDVIHVAGAGVRFAWDGERATPEQSSATSATPVVASGGDGRVVIADGSLIRREDVRLTHVAPDEALAWSAPIGVVSSAPTALAFCFDDQLGAALQDTAFCIAGDRRSIETSQPVAQRWGWSQPKPSAIVLRAGESAGDFNDIDLNGNGDLFVACGATTTDGHDGKILRLTPTGEIQRSRRGADTTPRHDSEIDAALASADVAARCAAVRATAALPDERARVFLRRAMSDKVLEVRAQVISEIARQLREQPLTRDQVSAWSELLASSADRWTNEPRLARLVARAMHAMHRASVRVGQVAEPLGDMSPLIAQALIDLKLADLDEARAVIADLLRTPGGEATLERVGAALRLNDRRPARLRLDGAPSNWSSTDATKLDAPTQRAIRRIQWPGRSDALMDPEPPPSIADVIERGRRLYSNCLTCHGAAGRGQAGVYPPLAKSEFVSGDATRLIAIVLHGLEGSVDVNGQTFAGTMPPPPLNSDDDLAAILTYVRQAFGNEAEPVTKEMIGGVRAKTAARAKPWTIGELEKALAQ